MGRLDELHAALDHLSQDMDETKPEPGTKETATMNGHAEPASDLEKKTAAETNT